MICMWRVIVAARGQVVLGLDEIERDHPRLRADQRRRDGGRYEHVVERRVAQHLPDQAERDAAAGLRVLRIAGERSPDPLEVARDVAPPRRDAVSEAG
jgi:hypothetical protein